MFIEAPCVYNRSNRKIDFDKWHLADFETKKHILLTCNDSTEEKIKIEKEIKEK